MALKMRLTLIGFIKIFKDIKTRIHHPSVYNNYLVKVAVILDSEEYVNIKAYLQRRKQCRIIIIIQRLNMQDAPNLPENPLS